MTRIENLQKEIEFLRKQIDKRQLTDKEKHALKILGDFWNVYVSLPPSVADPLCRDVLNAVHAIQAVIAVRVAMRCDPEVWQHDLDDDVDEHLG